MSRETELAARIVASARGWLGTPYMHQHAVKHVGCDCLGLLRGVWREVMGAEPLTPPPYSPDWAEASGRETLADAAALLLDPVDPQRFAAGDVLLFRWREGLPAKHCGIAASSDAMVHAHDGAVVAEAAIGPWWRRRIAYAFRFRNITAQEPTSWPR
jgi:NlpC/P60 family putative phage cell wall peptidase